MRPPSAVPPTPQCDSCHHHSLTYGCAHAIALGVNEPPDLREIAVPLTDVLNAGGLHEQGVVGCEHTCDALAVVLHQRRVLTATHECPHFLIRGDLGFLPNKQTKQTDKQTK